MFTKVLDEFKHLTEKINGGKKGDYEKDFRKIKFNSDDNLPLNEMLKIQMSTAIVRSVFGEDGKYYPQLFLDECLYEIKMLEYDKIDISEGFDINKTKHQKSVKFVIIDTF